MVDTDTFVEAKKRITSVDLLQNFIEGKTYTKIIDFIVMLQKSVESTNKNETPLPDVNTTI